MEEQLARVNSELALVVRWDLPSHKAEIQAGVFSTSSGPISNGALAYCCLPALQDT